MLAIFTCLGIGCAPAPPPILHDSEGSAMLGQIPFELETVELGELWEGQKNSRTLRIRNRSRETHHILEVTASCSCTTTDISQRVVGPNETTELVCEISPPGKFGETPDTAFTLSLGVRTAAGNAQQFKVTGPLRRLLPDGSLVDLGKLAPGTTHDFAVRIDSNEDSLECRDESKLIRFLSKEGNVAHFRLQVNSASTVGHHTQTMALLLHKAEHEPTPLFVQLSYTIVGRARAGSNTIALASGEKCTIEFLSNEDWPIKDISFRHSLPIAAKAVRSSSTAREIEISSLDPGPQEQIFGTVLVDITFADGSGECHAIPFVQFGH